MGRVGNSRVCSRGGVIVCCNCEYRPRPPLYSEAISRDSSWNFTVSNQNWQSFNWDDSHTFPILCRRDNWRRLDSSVNEVQAHPSLANSARLPTILTIWQTLIALQMTLSASETSRPDSLWLVRRRRRRICGLSTSRHRKDVSCALCRLRLTELLSFRRLRTGMEVTGTELVVSYQGRR